MILLLMLLRRATLPPAISGICKCETQHWPAAGRNVGVQDDEWRLKMLPFAEHLLRIEPFKKPDAHYEVGRVPARNVQAPRKCRR